MIEALQALRGVAQMTAATVVSELGSLARFQTSRQLMSYSGLVPREYSSGNRTQRGSMTKTGNAHLPRVLVESAWTYRHRPAVNGRLLKRQRSLSLSDETKRIAWRAQQRLYKRYTAMMARGKHKHQVVTALARGFSGSCAPSRCSSKRKIKRERRFNGPVRSFLLDSGADNSRGPTKRRTLDENYAARFPNPTRALSPRQLPSNHVPAVPTCVYQCAQPSR